MRNGDRHFPFLFLQESVKNVITFTCTILYMTSVIKKIFSFISPPIFSFPIFRVQNSTGRNISKVQRVFFFFFLWHCKPEIFRRKHSRRKNYRSRRKCFDLRVTYHMSYTSNSVPGFCDILTPSLLFPLAAFSF